MVWSGSTNNRENSRPDGAPYVARFPKSQATHNHAIDKDNSLSHQATMKLVNGLMDDISHAQPLLCELELRRQTQDTHPLLVSVAETDLLGSFG